MKHARSSRIRKRSKPAARSTASPDHGRGKIAEARPDSTPDRQRQIQDLIDLLKRNNLTELEWECEGYRVRLRHDADAKPAAPPSVEATVQSSSSEPATAKELLDTAGLVTITSPIVGTFYRSPSPDADAYVEEGDTVKKGQVLCIVEAMKLMNEIESEVDGRIVKILMESSKPVEYGQPLFLIEPIPGP